MDLDESTILEKVSKASGNEVHFLTDSLQVLTTPDSSLLPALGSNFSVHKEKPRPMPKVGPVVRVGYITPGHMGGLVKRARWRGGWLKGRMGVHCRWIYIVRIMVFFVPLEVMVSVSAWDLCGMT